jgi:protein gp37
VAETSIEWSEMVWNPLRGCTKVSPGCKHCYAETFSERWRGIKGHPFEQGFDLRLVPEALDKPLRWKKPRKIFVNSMSDLFHEDVPNEYIAAVFGVMAACPQHTFQVLTKRAKRMREWFAEAARRGETNHSTATGWCLAHASQRLGNPSHEFAPGALPAWPLPNVHLGVSVEDQERADERIPPLLHTPAAVRWISAEPLLGPVDLGPPHDMAHESCEAVLDWVVVGAESGRHNRLMRPEWVRSLRDQCTRADIAFFYKQDATPAGRKIKLPVLDGRQWQEYPR